MRVWRASAAVVAIAMTAGTVLGTVRELVIRRWLSEDIALALETPPMLVVCWFAIRWATRRFEVERTTVARLWMGGAILVLQVLAEDLLTRVLRGGSVFAHWGTYRPAALALTAAGLLAFAAMPLFQLRVGPPHRH
jgi:hypothetical protein